MFVCCVSVSIFTFISPFSLTKKIAETRKSFGQFSDNSRTPPKTVKKREMGVPTLFKWLVSKYPKAISDCVEENGTYVDDVYVPPDVSAPNPNGIEFDNFYLDMNGIIHNCSHAEGLDKLPSNENEMFENIFL